jgi:cytochrome P450
MKTAPGPQGFWKIMKLLIQRQLDPIKFYESIFKEYGDVACIRLGEHAFLMLNDADAIEQVLQTDAKNFTKSSAYERFKLIFGNGLLTSNGELWKKQRRLMSGAFSSKNIEKLHPLIIEETMENIKGWEKREKLNLADEMNRLTLHIITKTMLGNLNHEDTVVIKNSVQQILGYLQTSRHLWLQLILAPFPIKNKLTAAIKIESKLPFKSTKTFFQAIKDIDQLVLRMIEERKKLNLNENLLDKLIRSCDDEDQVRMSNEQLRDEVVNILIAGHETTANALSWTFHQLLEHPAVYQKVTAEIDQIVKGKAPTYEELPELVYTEAVIKETIRLYPPFWRISRRATVDIKIKDYHIPAGTNVINSIYTVQRKEAYWVDPLSFRPERFLQDQGITHRFAYIPFGAGPRICIGSHLAMNEAVTIIATSLKRYQISKNFTHAPTPLLSLTMQPKEGCHVLIKRRIL